MRMVKWMICSNKILIHQVFKIKFKINKKKLYFKFYYKFNFCKLSIINNSKNNNFNFKKLQIINIVLLIKTKNFYASSLKNIKLNLEVKFDKLKFF